MFEELRGIIIEEPGHYHNVNSILPTTDLQTLYKQGWWITEIFGTYAVLVIQSRAVTRTSKKPYFLCRQAHINVNQITPEVQKIIDKVRNQQWNKYKNYLLGKTNEN